MHLWREIGQLIIDSTVSGSPLQIIDSKDWIGPAFLNETWRFSRAKKIGYHPQLNESNTRAAFRKALINCIDSVQKQSD
jgi:hypothetical protein